MPKISWTRPKVNCLSALLKTYKKERRMTSEQLGKLLGVTGAQVRAQINKPADKWQIGRLKLYCDALDIPYDEAVMAAIQK